MQNSAIVELTHDELDEVSGGFLPILFVASVSLGFAVGSRIWQK